jgi:hypothetical protein
VKVQKVPAKVSVSNITLYLVNVNFEQMSVLLYYLGYLGFIVKEVVTMFESALVVWLGCCPPA